MLTFLAPSGLLALLSVAVPVAIHLWNRRPGRTVPVGSIRWLAVAANHRMRNLKLEQWLLLLLRAALVVLLAAVVARPVWQKPPAARRGQVFISPDLLSSESIEAVRRPVDALRRRGFALRQLRQGFPRISDTLWQRLRLQPLPPAAPAPHDFWTRVGQAADSFPGQPVRVYTSAALRYFRGIRPVLPSNVVWQTVPLPAARATWLAAASLTSANDSLRLLLSNGTSEAVTTSRRTVALPRQNTALLPRVAGLPPLRYQSSPNGQSFIQVLDSDSLRVPVQTRPLRVWVYYDAAHAPDARYLQAALRAAALGLAPRLALTVATTPPPPTTPLDWLCWLSSAPLPTHWEQQITNGLTLWQDGRPPGIATKTSFRVAPHESLFSIARLDTSRVPNAAVVWAADDGQPVLSRQQIGRGRRYQFHTRLHPAWSTLANSPELPLLWLSLLQPDSAATLHPHDPRQLAPAQVAALQKTTSQPIPSASASHVDLHLWLLMAAIFLFLLERWLAGRIAANKTLAV